MVTSLAEGRYLSRKRSVRLSLVILALLAMSLDSGRAGSAGRASGIGEERAPSARSQGAAMDHSNPYTSTNRIVSQFIPEDFVPDGDLNKPVWETAQWEEFDHAMAGAPSYPQAETRVAALWTAGYVYFGFRCRYTSLNIYQGEDPAKERWELWNRDVAEVFLNPRPERVSHYYEFEVAPNNQWIDLEIDKTKTPFNDAGWDSHFEHATRIDAGNHVWTCEMRVAVKSLGVEAVRAGDEWRLNFFRADGPGNDSERRFMSWSTIPEGKSFHVPERFGTIHFGR